MRFPFFWSVIFLAAAFAPLLGFFTRGAIFQNHVWWSVFIVSFFVALPVMTFLNFKPHRKPTLLDDILALALFTSTGLAMQAWKLPFLVSDVTFMLACLAGALVFVTVFEHIMELLAKITDRSTLRA